MRGKHQWRLSLPSRQRSEKGQPQKSTLKHTFQKQLNITPTFKKFLQEIQTHPS